MEEEFPKRIFKEGNETEVGHINNSCRMSVMDKIQDVLPGEYKKVKRDPVFAHVFALHENSLGYSCKLIHSMMCRQLVMDKKYEIWCVFGKRPLRFLLQEFHAMTGLNCSDDKMINNLNRWKDNNGFWSNLLKAKEKITMQKLIKTHLPDVKKWELVDQIRFVYVCVIAGVIMAKGETKEITHKYIKLVMDIDKVQSYPWGRDAFELLVESIINTQDNLKNSSYVLDGFSYSFQIWIMEAIPELGKLLAKKINNDVVEGPQCSNWEGVARISYDDIKLFESTFKMTDDLYPYISSTGYFDMCESAAFLIKGEIFDVGVAKLNALIRSGYNFGEHIWKSLEDDETTAEVREEAEIDDEVFEDETEAGNDDIHDDVSVSGLKRGRKKLHDHGAEKRKKKLLCQRVAGKHGGLHEDLKSFIQGIFNASSSSFEEKVLKNISERMGKLENEFLQLKNSIYVAGFSRFSRNAETLTTTKPSTTNDPQPNVGVSKKE